MPGELVAYDPNNAVQQRFLASLARGETGGGSGSSFVGYGGIDLSHTETDQYGFPLWGGVGNTHAAGTYQFQPGTWRDVASRFGLNFQNPQDQNAGAWYLAEETYSRSTGHSLQADLAAGNVSQVQSALAAVWPSVNGNGANPQGLAASFLNGLGLGNSAGASGGATAGAGSQPSIIDTVVNIFQRFGLVIIGAIIVLVALWVLLAERGVVPGPGTVAKTAGAAIAAA